MNEFDVYKFCLENYIDINYKRVSLCNLRNYGINRQYQVHAEGKNVYSNIFADLDTAINKFIELKNATR